MLAEASQVLSLLTPCIPPAVRGPSTFFDFHRLKIFGKTSESAIKVQGVPKKTHFQNCVGYVWGPNFLVILVILNKHHCSRHFRPLLVFLVILAHLLVNPGLFGHFWLFLVILVIFGYFGYFWLFLVIFGYFWLFWLFLVIFGYFWLFWLFLVILDIFGYFWLFWLFWLFFAQLCVANNGGYFEK